GGRPCPDDVSTSTSPVEDVNLFFPRRTEPAPLRKRARFPAAAGAGRTRRNLFVVMSFPSVKRLQTFRPGPPGPRPAAGRTTGKRPAETPRLALPRPAARPPIHLSGRGQSRYDSGSGPPPAGARAD